jgi:hypothetical protein
VFGGDTLVEDGDFFQLRRSYLMWHAHLPRESRAGRHVTSSNVDILIQRRYSASRLIYQKSTSEDERFGNMIKSALGFRVKSGWAMAVLLSGTSSSPTVIDRRRVELADPSVPESTQPFHAGLDLPKPEAAKTIGRLVKCVERFSTRQLAKLIKDYRAAGNRIVGGGITGGSTIDPQTIKNDHIRAHAEEGRLFRRVIQDGMKVAGLKVSVTAERDLFSKAVETLGISEGNVKTELTAMGKSIEGSWRSEEKAAALAAWMALVKNGR